jgi:membrane protease subunit (stomatin/prohibitin family)
MGLIDKIRGEFIDIVEWTDSSRDTMVWRFPRHDNEIKMGARLVVRESQAAVFVNEGTVADVFSPGTYELETQNLPVLSTLQGWKYGFHSPFKAEVYFVNVRLFTDLKWGTQNPVIVRDPAFGMVRLRAFGAYALRIVDPRRLVTDLAGTDPQFRTEEIGEYLRQTIVSRLSAALGAAGVSVLDLATRQVTLGDELATSLSAELVGLGIEIPRFVIENISLPPEVETALDRRSEIAIVGNLDAYTQLQAANALGDAARNQGGAGEGIGLGMGMAVGQRVAGAMGAAGAATPPPLPAQGQGQWYVAVEGQQRGPFDAAALSGYVAAGTLTAATLVWHAGMAEWLAAADVPAIAALMPAATPPPLPPTVPPTVAAPAAADET